MPAPPHPPPPKLALTTANTGARAAQRRKGLAWLVEQGMLGLAALDPDSARASDVRTEIRQAMRELREEDGVERMAEEIRDLKGLVATLKEALAGDSGSPYMGAAPATGDDPPTH